jgi:hypothetical protein
MMEGAVVEVLEQGFHESLATGNGTLQTGSSRETKAVLIRASMVSIVALSSSDEALSRMRLPFSPVQ